MQGGRLALMVEELRAAGCTVLVQNGHSIPMQASVTQHGPTVWACVHPVGADVNRIHWPEGRIAEERRMRDSCLAPQDWEHPQRF